DGKNDGGFAEGSREPLGCVSPRGRSGGGQVGLTAGGRDACARQCREGSAGKSTSRAGRARTAGSLTAPESAGRHAHDSIYSTARRRAVTFVPSWEWDGANGAVGTQ